MSPDGPTSLSGPIWGSNGPIEPEGPKWVPIVALPDVTVEKESEIQIQQSPNGYISFDSGMFGANSSSEVLDTVDVVHFGQCALFCSSSKEARNGHGGDVNYGQDAASVVYVDGHYLIVQADGVGSAFMSEIAAREVTKVIASHPSAQLKENLKLATDSLQNISLPEPETGVPLLDDGLKKTRDKSGSQTMLNQYSIDTKTGEVDGLYLGDGGFTVLRSNGNREHYPSLPLSDEVKGRTGSRLSSKIGIIGAPQTTEEFVGEVILQPGDRLIIYSDSMQYLVGEKFLIDKICDAVIAGGESIDSEIVRLMKELESYPGDDDKTLIIFTMPSQN